MSSGTPDEHKDGGNQNFDSGDSGSSLTMWIGIIFIIILVVGLLVYFYMKNEKKRYK